jgi:hypothetical protein
VGTAAVVVGTIVATGAAYITSRVINGNPNKGGNAAQNQGGRIQVPPATNNKIPVVYGSAYVNGIITDARLKSIGGVKNDTMYYCLVLSEYTNNLTVNAGNFIVGQKYTISVVGNTNFVALGAASNTVGITFTATGTGTAGETGQARYNSVYGLESVLWNDLRLTPVNTTDKAHEVKDGRKVVNPDNLPPTNAGSFVVGSAYVITKRGNTDFTLIGAQTNNIGQIFTATGTGTAGETGQAQLEDFVDENFINDGNSLVELRVYAGGSDDSNQIYPPQTSGNTVNAYTFWANNDGSWTAANEMKGLVYAIVKVTWNGDKGFTGLPNMTFQLANNVSNPADVWYDYMTSKRYGAGIDSVYIDSAAKLAWYNFCEEDINYTNVAGETNQSTIRYSINGVIDTFNPVKTNIDTIMQNGGAWLSYNVATGLWSPVIKKAVSAGDIAETTKNANPATTTLFKASRTGSTLTVVGIPEQGNRFPTGRIEAGQLLYNSAGTYLGTITAQLAPTAGETAGQIGRYTTDISGVVSTTYFYTLPASTLAFTDDNIISGINISSTRLDDLYNQVETEFYNRYNKDQKAYYRNSLDAGDRNPNEPDNQLRMNLDLVNSSMQADLIGQLELRQSRDDLVVEFTTNQYGIQAQAGDVISITSELYGWAPKYFRVMRVKEQETEDGGLVAQIQALEYNPDVYTIEPITEFSTSANIGIGNLVSSVGLPPPETPTISNANADASVPNFTFSVDIPATGGPFDEVEVYFTEGWDPNSVTGWIDNNSTPGTYSGVAGNIMTVTAVTFNSINPGDYFDLGGVTVVNQLTTTAISTKTFASGGAIGAFTVTLNNTTNIKPGQKPGLNSPAVGIPADAMVVSVSGNTVTLDKAFTAQASGNYDFTTAGGTGTYTVSISLAAVGTDDLFDKPVDADFKYLKKIVPQGNESSFTANTTVSTIVSELPANSQTFRRYFLKARLGVKKNFGAFSPNSPLDLDANAVNWNPNPVAAGSLEDLSDVDITPPINDQQALVYSSSTGKWGNYDALSVYGTSTNPTTNTNILNIYKSYTGTGTIDNGFGVGLQFNIEDTSGSYKMNAAELLVGTKDKTLGAESYYLSLEVTDGGTSSQTALEVSMSDTKIAGDLTINYDEDSASAIIYAKTSGTDSTLIWDGTNWTFANQFGLANNLTTTPKGVQGIVANNDYWFVGGYDLTNGGDNTGAMVIASGNNGDEPIYVRQYTGGSTAQPFPGANTVARELTLLDASGNTIIPVSLALSGATSGSVKFTAPLVAGTQSYTLPTGVPAANGYVLASQTDGTLSWVANPDTNTTYTISAETVAGGANLRLTGSDASTDNVKFASGTNTTVTRTDANTITISSTGDVVGPASATDNAVVRFDLTTGKLIQNSGVIIDDSNNISGVNSIDSVSYITNAISTRVADTVTTTSASEFTLTSTAARDLMKVIVNIISGTSVHCCEALVLRVDATTALLTVYGEMFNTTSLASFAADVSGGSLRLRVTPASATSTTFTYLRDSLN